MTKPDMTIKRLCRLLRGALPRIVMVCLVAGLILAPVHADARSKKARKSTENHKYAAIVLDADSGQILSESGADKRLHPASLTKIMTLLLTFEALDQGRLSLHDRIYISRHAATMSPSKLGIKPGSSIRVQDAIYAVVTKSANDISVALAEHLAGSESNFARRMTAKAQALGMNSSRFVNASGLHDVRQISTARDMAKLARYVILNYPQYYRYYSTNTFTYAGQTMHNHNRLMEKYQGMDGMKTGYVAASGFNLVASAVRNNHRLIGVVFGGRSSQSRNTQMASLLDAGFQKVKSIPQDQGRLLMASLDTPSEPANAAAEIEINENQTAKEYAPVPARKPGILLAAAALNKINPAAMQDASAQNPGNIVPAVLKTQEQSSETVLANAEPETKDVAPPTGLAAWAIQVGAFTSRAATDKALHDSMQKLPVKYASLSPTIAPMKTSEGWLFRARLHGLSKNEAFSACSYLNECVPVAPKNK